MTASQSLKIYKTLNKHFNNTEDAKLVIEQIEQIVEEKISAKKDILLTKDDKIELLNRIEENKIELLNRIDSNFKWLLGIILTLFGIVIGLLVNVIRLLPN